VEILVVANGCTDDTVAVARRRGFARVLETPRASKAAAMNLGDAEASAWPRLYLDADIEATPVAVADTLHALTRDEPVAARPVYEWDTAGAAPLVRAYYRARGRLTIPRGALWGAGVYGVNEAGHGRFARFPAGTADDVFIDRLFAPSEKHVIDTEPVLVRVPRTTRSLLRVLRRQARGAREHASRTASGTARQLAGTVRGPLSLADAAVYAALSLLSRRSAPDAAWERDETSRARPATPAIPEARV